MADVVVIVVRRGLVEYVYASPSDGRFVVVDRDDKEAYYPDVLDVEDMEPEEVGAVNALVSEEDEDTVSDDDGEGLDEEVLTVW
jgi:hypothetical protein